MSIWIRNIALAGLLLPQVLRAQSVVNPPPFQELLGLVQSNLAGITPAELDQAAARGLLAELGGRIQFLTNAPPETATVPTNAVARTNLFDGAFAYLRIAALEEGAEEALRSALASLQTGNKLSGLVLDLRFVAGTNYPAAMAVCDLFLGREVPLLQVQDQVLKSKARPDATDLPVAVLVNRQTAGSAEALAGVLRHYRVALLIGSRTAGQAMIYSEFPLSDGRRLRMATAYLRMADGPLLPSRGLKPDIELDVPEADEKRWYADSFAVLSGPAEVTGATRSVFSRPVNEAELVRRHREEQNPDAERPAETASAAKPALRQVQDPALGRALDLLKGIALVHPAR
jgi:hypothetical protein